MRRLKLVYALIALLWAGYWSMELLTKHNTDRIPFSGGTALCLLLFIAIPALGYALLFKLFPLAGRFLRR
jgi:hypothetical protein